jgi:hypothetical protein
MKKQIILTKDMAKAYYRSRGNKGYFVIYENNTCKKVPASKINKVKRAVACLPLSSRVKPVINTDSSYYWYEKLENLRTKVGYICNLNKYELKIQ